LQHRQFATTLVGVQQQRSIGDAFGQQTGPKSIVDNMAVDLLVGSGGVLSHAPRMEQTAMLLIDAFEPEGITRLAKDSIFMMPHLGVLASVHPRAAMEVFERDCLVFLGTCIAPQGRPKPGQLVCRYTIEGGLRETGELRGGELVRIRLDVGQEVQIILQPAHGFDVGSGPGKTRHATIHGGTVGIILDGRGRPLELPADRASCRELVLRWNRAIEMYPEKV
jgi:hypothetical protein